MDLNDLVKNPEQIKQLISILQNLVNASTEETKTVTNTVKKTRNKKSNTTKNKQTKQSNNRANKFLDMPERDLHKEDIEIDKRLQKLPPTPRSRRFQQLRATCRVCGKTENVSPGYITTELDRYKCNRCSGAAG
jgi:type VI protein secretion system component VasK